jgi:hypothetical protein
LSNIYAAGYAAAPVLYLNSNGNVGVGKAPAYALDVVGTINVSGDILRNGQSAAATSNFRDITASNALVSGNVNILGQLQQNGVPFVSAPYVASGVVDTSNSSLVVKSSSVTSIVCSNGQVSIGAGGAAPRHTLDVSGDVNFTGNIYQNGQIYTPTVNTSVGENIFATTLTLTSNMVSRGLYLTGWP